MSSPRRRVLITGTGLISPLGDSAEDFHRALCDGKSGLRETAFEELPELGTRPAGRIDFAPRDYLPNGKIRPLDRTGQMVIAAARLALEDAGWSEELCAEHEVGLVLGTMFCSLRTIVAFDQRALEAGPKYVRPFDFANTVINAAAGQTAIWHRLRGVNSTLAGGTAAGLEALAYAADLVRSGRCEALVAGGSDELCFESFLSFHRSGLLCDPATEARPVPFDRRRNGMAPAEGAALLVLESEESARRRGATVLGEVRGHASAFDPSRGTDRASARESVRRTLHLALDDASLDREDIDALSASANGGRSHDEHEALGIADAFAGRSAPLPVTAVKSMTGEALGASGAFQALSMVESLRRGELPGIHGLDRDLLDEIPGDVPGKDSPLDLRARTRTLDLRHGMVSALGLDGNVCAVVIGPGETVH